MTRAVRGQRLCLASDPGSRIGRENFQRVLVETADQFVLALGRAAMLAGHALPRSWWAPVAFVWHDAAAVVILAAIDRALQECAGRPKKRIQACHSAGVGARPRASVYCLAMNWVGTVDGGSGWIRRA